MVRGTVPELRRLITRQISRPLPSRSARGETISEIRGRLMRRVVVTGMGMVTPVGHDLESTWTALLEGKSGVGPISLFDARTSRPGSPPRSRISASADYLRRRRPVGRAFPEHQVRPGRRPDGHQGFGPARVASPTRPPRFGVYLGAGEGQQDFPRFVQLVHESTRDGPRCDTSEFTRLGLHELHPIREAEQEPGTPAATSPASSAPGARTRTA